jgi:hypothetical protein
LLYYILLISIFNFSKIPFTISCLKGSHNHC